MKTTWIEWMIVTAVVFSMGTTLYNIITGEATDTQCIGGYKFTLAGNAQIIDHNGHGIPCGKKSVDE